MYFSSLDGFEVHVAELSFLIFCYHVLLSMPLERFSINEHVPAAGDGRNRRRRSWPVPRKQKRPRIWGISKNPNLAPPALVLAPFSGMDAGQWRTGGSFPFQNELLGWA